MENSNSKKTGNTIVKDSIVLCCITLISGLLLGLAYEATKEPIANQKLAESIAAYKLVYADAKDFAHKDTIDAAVKKSEESLKGSGKDFGNVVVNEALQAKDTSSAVIGYVVSTTSKDGYGGNITISAGVSADGTLKGIEILEISETAGLGAKATQDSFKSQYKDKKVEMFKVTKKGKSADNEIDAISGATITSNAVTNAVNASLYFVNNCIEK
jgi:electron transport complex protein RnfG